MKIPQSVTSIGDMQFARCLKLTSIDVDDKNTSYRSVHGVLYTYDGTKLVSYPTGSTLQTYVVPYGTTTISDLAFDNCESIKKIALPETLEYIGGDAFDRCYNLAYIAIPTSVTYIGDWAFTYCNSMTDIYYAGSKEQWDKIETGSYGFLMFNGVTVHYNSKDPEGDVRGTGACGENLIWTLADGTLTISGTGDMFDWHEVNIDPTYTGDGAVISISGDTIISTTTKTPWYSGSSTIATCIVEDGATSIGEAFAMSCSNLTNLTIPASVKRVGKGAFVSCNKLADVYYEGTEAQWIMTSIESNNDPLLRATMHYSDSYESLLENAVKYVPYATIVPGADAEGVAAVRAAELPDWLTLNQKTGELSGMPTVIGSHKIEFTLLDNAGIPMHTFTSTLRVQENTNTNVNNADDQDSGYRIIQKVPDMTTRTYKDQVFIIDDYDETENFDKFKSFYLDGRELKGGKIGPEFTYKNRSEIPEDWEYYAEKGSTKITILDETIESAGVGTHTIAATFEETKTDSDGRTTTETKTVAQNYTVTNPTNPTNPSTPSSRSSGGSSSGGTSNRVSTPQQNATITSGEFAFTVTHGIASVKALTDSQMNTLRTSEMIRLTLDLRKGGNEVIQTVLPAALVAQLLELLNGDNAIEQIEIVMTNGSISLNKEAMSAIASQGNGDLTFTMEESDISDLTEAQQKALSVSEVAKVMSINLKIGTKEVKNFGGSRVETNLAFAPVQDHEPRGYAVWYAGVDGTMARHASTCTAESIRFRTAHFSTFAILYGTPVPFPDVTDDAWYASEVDQVASVGLMRGTDRGFEPETVLTRAMLAQIFYNAEHGEAGTPAVFADVPADAWYADAVNWVRKAGIASGTSKSNFSPDLPVTREQMASMLYNYTRLKNRNLSATASLDRFKDGADVSGWAEVPVKWAVGLGLIDGMDGKLAASGNVTRAQAAKLLVYYFEGFEQ